MFYFAVISVLFDGLLLYLAFCTENITKVDQALIVFDLMLGVTGQLALFLCYVYFIVYVKKEST